MNSSSTSSDKGKLDKFIKDIDAWVIKIQSAVSSLKDLKSVAIDNQGNIQHNHELIYSLKDQIEELKNEIHAMKLIQIIHMRKSAERREEDGKF